jgi:hypothetical protein
VYDVSVSTEETRHATLQILKSHKAKTKALPKKNGGAFLMELSFHKRNEMEA